jgi:hypothetical protein
MAVTGLNEYAEEPWLVGSKDSRKEYIMNKYGVYDTYYVMIQKPRLYSGSWTHSSSEKRVLEYLYPYDPNNRDLSWDKYKYISKNANYILNNSNINRKIETKDVWKEDWDKWLKNKGVQAVTKMQHNNKDVYKKKHIVGDGFITRIVCIDAPVCYKCRNVWYCYCMLQRFIDSGSIKLSDAFKFIDTINYEESYAGGGEVR